MNLLEETIDFLNRNGRSVEEVIWCGSEQYGYFEWDHFKIIADFEYDSGFGGPEIAQDLKIVGPDFWLERHEYDGSEWWEFKKLPQKPLKKMHPTNLKADIGWNSLAELNDANARNEGV